MTHKELEAKVEATPFPPPMIWFNTPEKWAYYKEKYGDSDWFLNRKNPLPLWRRKVK